MSKVKNLIRAAAIIFLAESGQAAPAPAEYVGLLEKWNGVASKWTHPVENEPGLAYYGTGGHEHWAVQANCTAFGALAVLATAPELDEKKAGATREQLRERALQSLRYILATHKSGRMQSTSGGTWGHGWISSLGFERMAHAIALLRPWLTQEDQATLRRVMISESDFLLNGYPVVGAIDNSTKKNHPESNLWCGSLLYRTQALYPDAPNAAKYREKAIEFMLNGLSIPSDATSETVYSGKPLRDWHTGPNYTENFGLNHHGYLNVGYMVICLSNIAMLHYSCLDYGITPPPEIYHHAAELWRLVKSLTFPDGRLWRIGGDTRVRYCYCQDYAVPMWMLARDLWGDTDADRFLSGWVKLAATEQNANPDGGFLSSRLAGLAQISPLYYSRLEGDRAGTLSMAATWMRRPDSGAKTSTAPAAFDAWEDDFHGAVMVRGKRLASWVWKAAELPTGMVLPADRSDLAEWNSNLVGIVGGAGCELSHENPKWIITRFAGGFLNTGSYQLVSSKNPAEGTGAEKTAQAQIVFAALPDDSTVVVLQQARTLKPTYLNEVSGLSLNIPNDVYNAGERTYLINGTDRKIAGAGGIRPPETETIPSGDRIGIEGRMEVQAIYGGALQLRRPGKRLINLEHSLPLKFSGEGANLYCDAVCLPYGNQQKYYGKDALLFDIGAAVAVDGKPQAELLSEAGNSGKLVKVTAADGREYLLAANFGSQKTSISLPKSAERSEVLGGPKAISGASGLGIGLAPGEASLLRLPRGH